MLDIKSRNRWILLRIAAIACLIFSLFYIPITRESSDTCTIFLVDRSLSALEHENAVQAYVNKQIETKGKKDTYTIISFGKDAMIEVPSTREKKEVIFNTKIDSNFTNLENALNFAVTCFPDNTQKRLVLFTDAEENIGNYREAAFRLAKEDINLLAYSLKRKEKTDVQFTKLQLPASIYENGDMFIVAEIEANYRGEGIINIYGDGEKIVSKAIDFAEGSNSYEIKLDTGNNFVKKITGEIIAVGDENPQNNRATAYIYLEDRPKVLIIGEKNQAKNVVSLTRSLGIDIDTITAREANYTIEDLSEYGQIILVNVAHDAIGKSLEDAIEYCVRQLGSGLLVIGGENSFALGGYKGTLLEKMLPVDSLIKADKEKASMGLIVVVDASGSMEDGDGHEKKLELAKHSIVNSTKILDEEDYLGVMAFSDTFEWIVPYEKSPGHFKIEANVSKISARGGTLILPAIKEAMETLKNSDTKINHIVLMTDGEGEKEGYDGLLREMEEEGITLSTIAIGVDADKRFLEELSNATGGRSYFAENAAEIPKLLTEENYVASRKYVNEREILPQYSGNNNSFSGSMPNLYGYVSTTLKEGSHLILATDLGEPLLAERNYGLGRTMVWTSDLEGKWSDQWIDWEEMTVVWREMVNTNIRQQSFNEDEIEMDLEGGNLHLRIKAKEGAENVRLEHIYGSAIKFDRRMRQTSKGIFEENLYLEAVGEYLLNIHINSEDGESRNYRRKVALDYSPEHDMRLQEDKRLEVFKDFTLIDNSTEVFKHPLSIKTRSYRDLKDIFLTLAIIFFISDLWLRKNWRRFWA
ncbi:Mg-chelatase subunit ChlD [Anaerovirgula multivorans]|uniref:Mg-chelatase subunit ChlD n=1 Tax=Anaerovirgula multivorans TaxID=312168 RepID=A0A239CAD8_9FIRM|nr:VWA domain-containing protein [Anaerovirgula multivorans]SNS16591.1 Mg-chelatase subunit ChlD [Anaerovirgula multivorans]